MAGVIYVSMWEVYLAATDHAFINDYTALTAAASAGDFTITVNDASAFSDAGGDEDAKCGHDHADRDHERGVMT